MINIVTLLCSFSSSSKVKFYSNEPLHSHAHLFALSHHPIKERTPKEEKNVTNGHWSAAELQLAYSVCATSADTLLFATFGGDLTNDVKVGYTTAISLLWLWFFGTVGRGVAHVRVSCVATGKSATVDALELNERWAIALLLWFEI
jgi:hypothetical protein